MVEGAWEWQLAAACVTSKSALDWRCRRGRDSLSVPVVERVMSFTSPAIATGVSARLVNHVLSSMCQHHGHRTSRGVVGELPAVQLCIR